MRNSRLVPYFLDSDSFIRANRLHYRFEFCPAFWDWLEISHSRGIVYSVQEVEIEINRGDDELKSWISRLNGNFFITPDQDAHGFETVSSWLSEQDYTSNAIDESYCQSTTSRFNLITH